MTRHINGKSGDFFDEFVKIICPFVRNMFLWASGRKKGEKYTAGCKIYSKIHRTHLSLSTQFRAFTEYGNANALRISVIYNVTSRVEHRHRGTCIDELCVCIDRDKVFYCPIMSAGEYENYTVTSQNYDSSKQKKCAHFNGTLSLPFVSSDSGCRNDIMSSGAIKEYNKPVCGEILAP